MATPTHCTIYTDRRPLLPLERGARRPALDPTTSASLEGPDGQPCPGADPALQPAPRGRHLQPARRRLLATSPEARPRRRRPVPRRPQLQDAARLHRRPARHRLLPGGLDRRRRAEPGPGRAAGRRAARRPARSAPPTSPPGPAPIPSTRSAGCTWPGPFKGAPLSLVAVTPALAGPYDYGVVVVRVALHVDPLTAQVIAVSDTVPSIIGGIPIRMRSIQVNIDRAELHDQPDQLRARSRSTRRGSATRARSPTSPPPSTRSTARPCPSSRG